MAAEKSKHGNRNVIIISVVFIGIGVSAWLILKNQTPKITQIPSVPTPNCTPAPTVINNYYTQTPVAGSGATNTISPPPAATTASACSGGLWNNIKAWL